jgi:hypothetical protein
VSQVGTSLLRTSASAISRGGNSNQRATRRLEPKWSPINERERKNRCSCMTDSMRTTVRPFGDGHTTGERFSNLRIARAQDQQAPRLPSRCRRTMAGHEMLGLPNRQLSWLRASQNPVNIDRGLAPHFCRTRPVEHQSTIGERYEATRGSAVGAAFLRRPSQDLRSAGPPVLPVMAPTTIAGLGFRAGPCTMCRKRFDALDRTFRARRWIADIWLPAFRGLPYCFARSLVLA